MVQVKVLGPGCARCKKLFHEAERAIAEAGVEAELTKVDDFEAIMAYGVAMTPALVMDDEVVSVGRIPRADKIAAWLAKAASGQG
ncbi:MAG: TM0996/MTH895 family glutaredoxin-like protein [Deltaproteobacteria bacterium]|nr:TM0996/MTH895 family glutaredoxin-like protein [Deltaproteobacteria bacterium]